ncbi:hypothetical protein [Mesobacillus selenatarsenatis]|uniref:hypothetical protein n=1 Tax=Mesobacillus selenatarsenatis TaxID=388741 RepID=UPI0005AA964F|nr:hypothetical protein [Mesobacillus selenatarsenatis]
MIKRTLAGVLFLRCFAAVSPKVNQTVKGVYFSLKKERGCIEGTRAEIAIFPKKKLMFGFESNFRCGHIFT